MILGVTFAASITAIACATVIKSDTSGSDMALVQPVEQAESILRTLGGIAGINPHMRQALFVLPLLAMLGAPAGASDWPQWRGPALNGISQDTSSPTKWSATENVAWKTPIPGKGHSSPIIVGQKVFLTTAIEEKRQRVLMCLDKKTGEVLWQKDVLESPLEK